MPGKLIMTKGLPASGKSTWASTQPGVVIVNKDDIRLEMRQDWSRDVEKEVLRIRDFRICEALNKGKTVISSDTNLALQHEITLSNLARKYKADFEVKMFNTPLEECIKRDSLRDEGKVGEKVIIKMATQYLGYKEPDKVTLE